MVSSALRDEGRPAATASDARRAIEDPGHVGLGAADLTAAAPTSSPVDERVAEFPTVPRSPGEQFSVDDHSTADPGGDRQVDHVRGTGPLPPPVLPDRRGVRVIGEERRPVERVPDDIDDRHPDPAGQVRRGVHDPGRRVQRAAAADADRIDLVSGQARLGYRLLAGAGQRLERGVPTADGRRGGAHEGQQRPGRVDHSGGELGRTDVQPERQLLPGDPTEAARRHHHERWALPVMELLRIDLGVARTAGRSGTDPRGPGAAGSWDRYQDSTRQYRRRRVCLNNMPVPVAGW